MKYYMLSVDTDPKIMGSYPQVENLRIDFHEAKATQFGVIDDWQSPSDYPDFNNFELSKRSKLTDVLNNNFVIESSGLILSAKAFRILSGFEIALSKHEKATVYERDVPHDYIFLWYNYAIEIVNYKKSQFHIYDTLNREYQDRVPIESKEEYKVKNLALISETINRKLYPKVVCMDKHYDLINFLFSSYLTCSEKLKDKIEDNGLTGFLFDEIDFEVLS